MEEPLNKKQGETISKKKIDELFDEIGYSYYHYFLLSILILIFFADGTEVLVISLILKSLQNEWNLSPFSKSCVASSAFIGLMIGSFVTSRNLDLHGRKKFLIGGGLLVLIFGFLSSLSSNSFQLFFSRVLMGIGIGTQIPAATNLAAESIPCYNRSIYLANMWIAFPLGELYVCIVAMYVMPNFEFEQWRTVWVYCLIPVFLCFIGSFFLYESSRFYLAYGKVDEAKEVLIKLSEWGKIQISESRLNDIVDEGIKNPLNKYESNYNLLVSRRFLGLSVNTWSIWFISSAGLYTTVYMLPQILSTLNSPSDTKKNVFVDVIISNVIAIPKTLIGGFLSEMKILGRKFTILLSFIFTAMASLLVILDVNRISLYGGIIKLMSGISMAVVKIYSTEAYPTKIRGLGYGTGHSFARLSGMLVPFLSEFLWYNFGLLSPFYFVLITSLIAVYNSHLLPFETLGRQLDHIDREDIIELKEINDFK
jgi:putative MFS transporter